VPSKETQKRPTSIGLKLFQGKKPPFDFMFEYPAAWKIKEREFKNQFNMVQVAGPRDSITRMIPGIFVKAQDVKETVVLANMADIF